MAFRRNRKTETTDETQRDPVIQRKPEPEVVEAIRAIPEEERIVVPVPVKAKAKVVEKTDPLPEAESKYGALEFFTEEFIDNLAKVPADLMFYLNNQEKAYKAKRATNLPGDDERATELLKRLNELRRVCKKLGYAV